MTIQTLKIYVKGTTTTIFNATDFTAQGDSIQQCGDGTLKSIQLQVRCTRSTLYELNTAVLLEITEGETTTSECFVIAKDNCVLIDKSVTPNIYQHTLLCVECTKYLEKIKFFNINLTNKSNSLYAQINRLVANAVLDKFGTLPKLYFNTTLMNTLRNIPSEDFFFNNTDLRSALDEMFQVFGHRCYIQTLVNNSGYLDRIAIKCKPINEIIDYSPTWDKSHCGTMTRDESTNDYQNFCGSLKARGYNSLNKNTITVTDLLKTNDANGNVTINNASLFLPCPIEDIMYMDIRINQTLVGPPRDGSSSVNQSVYVGDLRIPKKYFVTEEEYSLLPTGTVNKSLSQVNTIPYSKGNNFLSILGCSFNVLWETHHNIFLIINYVLEELYPSLSLVIDFDDIDILSKLFTVTFLPRIDTAIEITKPGVYDDTNELSIIDGQSSNSIDISRHGKNLLGKALMTGNDDRVIDAVADSYFNLMPLYARLEDGYVCYQRDITIYKNFINVRYHLSKNYNNIQKNIGVNREKRIYEIPKENTDCPLIVKNRIMFANEYNSSTGAYPISFLKNALHSMLYNDTQTFLDGYSHDVKCMLVRTHLNATGGATTLPATDMSFCLPTVNYGQSNQITFAAKMLDNYSVGYSRQAPDFSIWGDGGRKLTYNRYVDTRQEYIGEFGSFSLKLASDNLAVINPSNYTAEELALSMQIYPKVIDDRMVSLSNYQRYNFYKDRTQTPNFFCTLEFVPAKANKDDYIIGTQFCEKNNLIKTFTNRGLKIKYHTDGTKYFQGDMFVKDNAESIHDSSNNDYEPSQITIITETDASICFKIQDGYSVANVSSWCICDTYGNIYFASNRPMNEAIYMFEEN